MIRKFLKRSIPFLVAALVLIGTVAVPAQAAYFVPVEDNSSFDFSPYYSFLKFNVEAYNDSCDIIGFSMPSSYNLTQDTLRSDIFVYPDLGFMDNYRLMLVSERDYHSYLMDDGNDPSQLYLKHDIEFDYQSSLSYAPGTEFVPTEISYTFDDFVLMLSDCKWGSAFFKFNVPDGWTYSITYDYYFVSPVTYDDEGSTINVISEKHVRHLFGSAEDGDLYRSLIREDDYNLMVENGAPLDSMVLFSNVFVWMSCDGASGSDNPDIHFYMGYSKDASSYPLSSFFFDNDLVFGDVLVEAPSSGASSNMFGFLIDSVGGFFAVDLFGSFSIGDLLVVIFCILFVLAILKIIS